MSDKTPPQKKHMGTKFLGHFFGMVLAFIYAALQFFSKKILLIDDLYNIALVTVFFVVVWGLIIFLGEIMWRYAHKYSEMF